MVGSTAIILRMRHSLVPLFALGLLALTPTPALADLTAFIGANATPTNRPVRGFAGRRELSHPGVRVRVREHDRRSRYRRPVPSNRDGQSPRADALSGFGIAVLRHGWRRTLSRAPRRSPGDPRGREHRGGVKISLAGPLRLRVDYRFFTLRGKPLHPRSQRVYAGLNLMF